MTKEQDEIREYTDFVKSLTGQGALDELLMLANPYSSEPDYKWEICYNEVISRFAYTYRH